MPATNLCYWLKELVILECRGRQKQRNAILSHKPRHRPDIHWLLFSSRYTPASSKFLEGTLLTLNSPIQRECSPQNSTVVHATPPSSMTPVANGQATQSDNRADNLCPESSVDCGWSQETTQIVYIWSHYPQLWKANNTISLWGVVRRGWNTHRSRDQGETRCTPCEKNIFITEPCAA